MDSELNEVTVGGAPCTVVSSTIERIVCITSPETWVNRTNTTAEDLSSGKPYQNVAEDVTEAENDSVISLSALPAQFYGANFTTTSYPSSGELGGHI